jgi:hypothetical protein
LGLGRCRWGRRERHDRHFRRSRAVDVGDVGHRLRGDGLHRVSQDPCPISNLDQLTANDYLEGRLRAAFFHRPAPCLETLSKACAPGLVGCNPGHVRPRASYPRGAGFFFGRARIHRPDITAFAERCFAKLTYLASPVLSQARATILARHREAALTHSRSRASESINLGDHPMRAQVHADLARLSREPRLHRQPHARARTVCPRSSRPFHQDATSTLVEDADGEVLGRTSRPIVAPFRRRHPDGGPRVKGGFPPPATSSVAKLSPVAVRPTLSHASTIPAIAPQRHQRAT